MTATELQNIVRRLSNQCWCRYWLHWNHPQQPTQMAIQCVDTNSPRGFKPVRVPDLEGLGFRLNKSAAWFYVIDRTNEDGTPFVSQL